MMHRSPMYPRRCLTFVLFLSVFATQVGQAAGIPLTAATAKQMLQARGVGKTVKVKQRDGTELRAKIVSIGDASVVMQDGSKPAVDLPYDTLTSVNGAGLSKGAKIGIIVVVVIFIALLYPATHT